MWISANARIMAMLVDREDLHMGNIKDYMVKVGELASCYTWASVLLYNQEYRCRQAVARFHWGADSQHMSTIMLKAKSTTPGQTTLPKQHTATADVWVLGTKKSVSSSTQGNTCMVESVTLNTSAQCACRPNPSVTTAHHKPSPSRTRMSSNWQYHPSCGLATSSTNAY